MLTGDYFSSLGTEVRHETVHGCVTHVNQCCRRLYGGHHCSLLDARILLAIVRNWADQGQYQARKTGWEVSFDIDQRRKAMLILEDLSLVMLLLKAQEGKCPERRESQSQMK